MCRYMRENLIARKRKYIIKRRFKFLAASIVILASAGIFIAHKSALPATNAIFHDHKESSVTLTVSDDVYTGTQPIILQDIIDFNGITEQKPNVTDEVYSNTQPFIEQNVFENQDTSI